jgi:adenine deaminase
MELRQRIRAGRGEVKADLVVRGGQLVNVVSEEIYPADVAIFGGRVVATGTIPGPPGDALCRCHHRLGGAAQGRPRTRDAGPVLSA